MVDFNAKFNHFAAAGKMVFRNGSRLLAENHRPFDRLFEAPPLAVTEERLQIAGWSPLLQFNR